MSLDALAGTQTITQLAQHYQVSRKFVYQQAATAQARAFPRIRFRKDGVISGTFVASVSDGPASCRSAASVTSLATVTLGAVGVVTNGFLHEKLPYAVLDSERAGSVVSVVEARLWTPLGLRTLPPDDERYVPRYEGGVRSRDGSYHQGTVWPWLIGPFADASRPAFRSAV